MIRLSRLLPAVLFSLLGVAVLLFGATNAALAGRSLTQDIKAQEKKAAQTKQTLNKLSSSERSLHKELAQSEDRIQALEKSLSAQEAELTALGASRRTAEQEHARLLARQEKTEAELADLLEAMWPLYTQSQAGRGANTPGWQEADRHLEWTGRVFAAIDGKYAELAVQQQDLAASVAQQQALEKKAQERLAAVNRSKDQILRDRLRYNSQLRTVRKQKEDAEATLKDVLSVINSLNYQLQDAPVAGDFAKYKGALPWPARGLLSLRYAPGATPPTRGIGLSLPPDAEVVSVFSGKVVHNDILRGFGRVVIVMHDSAYYSLYAYLAASDLEVGQTVKRGQRLGTAGYFPNVEGPGLYFELRFHQKAINPEPWLTALN